ncbi:hypothetical protein JNW93_01315 [Lacticaseibacillus rhamnosus]|nr:hypothetical protein [Lacticaseibacillus rhamnosus]
MRRDFVKKTFDYYMSHPAKVDLPLRPEDIVPWNIDFSKEEWQYFYQLLKEANDKLTEWPAPNVN